MHYNQDILKSLLDLPSTNFKGYDENTFQTKIDLIIKNNKIIRQCFSWMSKLTLYATKQFFMLNLVARYLIKGLL